MDQKGANLYEGYQKRAGCGLKCIGQKIPEKKDDSSRGGVSAHREGERRRLESARRAVHGMHRNPMPFGRERWHRPPRFAHADSLRMGVQRGCEVHQVLQHIAADRLQLDLSRPSTPGWRASTEEVCASAW